MDGGVVLVAKVTSGHAAIVWSPGVHSPDDSNFDQPKNEIVGYRCDPGSFVLSVPYICC